MAKKIPRNINTTYDVVEAFRAVEDELISSMMRNMDHHRAEELKEGFNWSQWQVEQLAALDEYKKRNLKKYQGIFNNINSKIDTIISMQRAAGNAGQEISILKAIKEGAKLSKAKKQISATGMFFKANDNKINALIKATQNDFERGEIAILRRANDQYRKIIFNAQIYASSGASYEQAVDMAARDFLSAGINCIEYKNGARHTMSEYADMALRTAQKRAYLTGEGEKRMEWGISTVIMNKRGNPCPKCLPFVGKVLIDDVWSGGKPEDGPYPLMSKAIKKGLYHPRCKDSHTTYFPGISTADDAWSEEELEEIGQGNRQEIKQQYAARQAERFGRLAKYSLDKENKKKYITKAKEWEKQKISPDLTKDEEGAIIRYVSPDSYLLNDKLRRKERLTNIEKAWIINLDKALKKMPCYEGNLNRSLAFMNDEDAKDFFNRLIVGGEYIPEQYLSATKQGIYNMEGQVQIFIQNAKHGRDLGRLNDMEGEVLYESQSKFKVLNKAEQDGKYFILLEEV